MWMWVPWLGVHPRPLRLIPLWGSGQGSVATCHDEVRAFGLRHSNCWGLGVLVSSGGRSPHYGDNGEEVPLLGAGNGHPWQGRQPWRRHDFRPHARSAVATSTCRVTSWFALQNCSPTRAGPRIHEWVWIRALPVLRPRRRLQRQQQLLTGCRSGTCPAC